ncbi:nucleotidyl transferase AbiEii/AbiGii toxin family protein [Mesorhizobium sp. B292B1B]|nr:nucleotidyl transferase AbiEii/AbiGii toxin family protein [Mesorhizobium sp. B264B2A]MCA0009104.1 nucleotidyl transferase AbiEii/AbiGii toxin family protein [Mesorhizobium sp. B264B1B]MCA0014499.1 nucleotidyl transferase AbiEii/AbiGii toxin family protein [Mesorhizobium sp. B294B1A1]MCA0018244.1 nucleotidyl transferase AbiEii/AbiGii toxin family protein [Mesorhizobium sp. B264B1A]MCA0024720.1 nucleotidyl transferase AbiEii/AbiGii toxin family protein [Mesorhizobium sp. B263B1A]MCA0033355.1
MAKVLKNPAASIRDRLLQHSRQQGDDYQRILTRYAIERLLFRLSMTEASERYVLKGAMLFVTWPEYVFRPTGDLDLLGQGDPDPGAIHDLFTRICQVEAPDEGIVFDAASLTVDPVREGKYQGVRLNLKGWPNSLQQRRQVDFRLDPAWWPACREGRLGLRHVCRILRERLQ